MFDRLLSYLRVFSCFQGVSQGHDGSLTNWRVQHSTQIFPSQPFLLILSNLNSTNYPAKWICKKKRPELK